MAFYNMPLAITLYKALGLEPPQFAHLPMILGEDGARLSKRHGATAVKEERSSAAMPQFLGGGKIEPSPLFYPLYFNNSFKSISTHSVRVGSLRCIILFDGDATTCQTVTSLSFGFFFKTAAPLPRDQSSL